MDSQCYVYRYHAPTVWALLSKKWEVAENNLWFCMGVCGLIMGPYNILDFLSTHAHTYRPILNIVKSLGMRLAHTMIQEVYF